MANSININGQEYVIEGDELGSESTLRSLRNIMEGMSKNADKYEKIREKAERANLDVLKKTNEELDEYSKLTGKANKESGEGFMKDFNPLGMASNILGKITGSITGAVELITGVLATLVGALEKASSVLAEMYASGARFQGSLAELNRQAFLSGLGLEEFAKLISKNQAALTRFGDGSVKEGARRMGDLAQEITFGEKGLAGLGITVGQAAQYLVDYADIQQRINGVNVVNAQSTTKGTASYNKMISSVTRYVEDLDNMALMTGKTRDELHALNMELAKDPVFFANLSGVAPKAAEEFTKFATAMQSIGGPAIMDFINQVSQFGGAFGEVAVPLQRLAPQLQGPLTQIIQQLREGYIDNDTAMSRVSEMFDEKTVKQIQSGYQQLGLAATQLDKNLVSLAQNSLMTNQALERAVAQNYENLNKGKKWADLDNKQKKAALEDYRKQRSDEAKMVQEMNTKMLQLRGTFSSFILKFFENDTVKTVWNNLFGQGGILDKLSKTLLNILGDKDSTFAQKMTKAFTAAWESMRGVVDLIITPIWDKMKEGIVELFRGPIADGIKQMFGEMLIAAGAVETGRRLIEDSRLGRAASEAGYGADDPRRQKYIDAGLAYYDETNRPKGEAGSEAALRKQLADDIKEMERIGTSEDTWARKKSIGLRRRVEQDREALKVYDEAEELERQRQEDLAKIKAKREKRINDLGVAPKPEEKTAAEPPKPEEAPKAPKELETASNLGDETATEAPINRMTSLNYDQTQVELLNSINENMKEWLRYMKYRELSPNVA